MIDQHMSNDKSQMVTRLPYGLNGERDFLETTGEDDMKRTK